MDVSLRGQSAAVAVPDHVGPALIERVDTEGSFRLDLYADRTITAEHVTWGSSRWPSTVCDRTAWRNCGKR